MNLVTNWTQSGDRVHNHFIFGKNGWLEITDKFLRGNINGEDLNFKYGKLPTVDIRSTDGKLFDAFLKKDEMKIQTSRITDYIDHVVNNDPETIAPISRGADITRSIEEIYEKG
jgi:hypothetical protein